MNAISRIALLALAAVGVGSAGAAPVQPGNGGLPAAPSIPAPPAAPGVPAMPASAAEWGAVPARPVQSAFATARATSTATGDYFHDFGELIVRVRSVKWIEEICSEAFPATAEVNERAYNDWLIDHGAFVDEVEGQFAIIDRYWGDVSPQARKEGLDIDRLRARVEANRAGLKQDFHARTAVAFQRRCDAYPEVLLSPQLDLEKSQADYVTSVRLGPR